MTRREARTTPSLPRLRAAPLALAPLAAHCGGNLAPMTDASVDGGAANDAATSPTDGVASDRPAVADAATPDPRCEADPMCLAACATTFGACSTSAGPCATACETSANTCAASCDTAAMSCRAACGHTATCIAGCNALPAGAAGAARNACVSACNACEPSCQMTRSTCAAGCAMARRDCDEACGTRCGLGGGTTCAAARDRCSDACRPARASDAGARPDPSSVSGFCTDFCARASQVSSCADYASECMPQCEALYEQLACDASQRAAVFTCMRTQVPVTACEVPRDNPELGLQPVYDTEPCAAALGACGF